MTDTFTPKAGMICRTRDGQNVGPIDRGTDGSFFWHVVDGDNPAVFSDGVVMAWHKNGQWSKFHGDHRYDLIAEWSEPLPGLPISELGAKPGDTIRCVWVDEEFEDEYPVGFQAIVNGDGRFLGLTGGDWIGANGRWEIVKRADKPKGRKRARIAELEAQVAELIRLGNVMAVVLEGQAYIPVDWRNYVARIKP